MIDTLIFDFDGTLAATEHSILSVYNEMAERYGFTHIPAEAMNDMRAKTWKDLLTHTGISLSKVPKLLKEGQKIIHSRMETQQPCLEEIPAILDDLRAIVPVMGIISSNTKKNIKVFLSQHQIADMDFLISSPLFSKADKIKRVLRKFRHDAQGALYVGDEVRDVVAARSAGIRVAAATWGFNSLPLLEAENPDYLLESFDELLALVKNDGKTHPI